MKKTIFLAILLLFLKPLMGQKFTTGIGEPLPRLSNRTCVFIAKDGRSFYSYLKENSKHYWAAYDKNMKLIVEAEEKNGRIIKFMEIAGEVYFFRRHEKDLFRAKLNKDLQSVASEELLLSGKYNQIKIKQDVGSGSYGIIATHEEEEKKGKRDEYTVYHFSADHKQMSKSTFDYVNNTYQHGKFYNFEVYENYVITTGYLYNAHNDDSKLVFSKLEKGKSGFMHKETTGFQKSIIDKCIMQKNNPNKILQTMVYTQEGSDYKTYYNKSGQKTGVRYIKYTTTMQNLDPETMELKNAYPISNKKADQYIAKNYGSQKGFTDGNDIDEFLITAAGNNFFTMSSPKFQVFLECDVTGNEVKAWVYPANSSDYLPVLINGEYYVLTAEMEENMNKALNEKQKPVNPAKCHLVLLDLKNDGEITRKYVFEDAGKTAYSCLYPLVLHKALRNVVRNENLNTLVVRTEMSKDAGDQCWVNLTFE